MKFLVIVMTLFYTWAHASTHCENKFFTFSVKDTNSQSITNMDVLENISHECKMTLVFEDSSVKAAVSKELNYINVHDFSIKELLDLILEENNIFYTLSDNKKVLKLSV